MSKTENVDDLLGGDAAKATKAPKAKEPAKAAASPAKAPKAPKADPAPTAAPKPASKAPAKPAAKKAPEPAAAPKRERTPLQFEEGERDKLYAKITKAMAKVDKKGINTRELAEKLGTETRKLRVCLYTMVNRGEVKLKAGDSKVAGMTVCPA